MSDTKVKKITKKQLIANQNNAKKSTGPKTTDGKKIVDFDPKGIFLVRVDQQKVERLTMYRQSFHMDIAGTHPHVVWNHEGTSVLYNSAETGHSQLYMIPDVT